MRRGRLVAPVLALVLCAACGVPSREAAANPATTRTAARETAADNCSTSLLGAGFRRDDSYSGDLSPQQYSASADVQAALLYDQYQSGYRTVLTRLTAGKPTPAEVFASCVSMRFDSDADAARFLSSYRDLRGQAGDLAKRIESAPVGSTSDVVAYRETGQSFHAYGVTDADVIELASRSGSRLFISTVAGAAPQLAQAQALTHAMVAG